MPQAYFDEDSRKRIGRSVHHTETQFPRPAGEGGPMSHSSEFQVFLTKNDSGSTWSKGSTPNFHPYYGVTQGSESADTDSYPAYVRWGDIPAGKWALVLRVNGQLEMIQAEC